MAHVFINPHPHSRALSRGFNQQVFIIIAILGGLVAAIWLSQTRDLLVVAISYAAFFVALYFFRVIWKEIGKNERGEDAEIKVRKILQELPDDYSIYTNLKIAEYLDIDILLVGPTGIFALEVKSYNSYFRFQKQIGQAFREAMELKKHFSAHGLNMFVQAVLVLPKYYPNRYRGRNSVEITDTEFLLPFITRHKLVNYNRAKADELLQVLLKNS